jgi:hypothetical protein
MEPVAKLFLQKTGHNILKVKSRSAKNKSAEIKHIIHNLIHPDYILFDWEFYSNQLEFE